MFSGNQGHGADANSCPQCESEGWKTQKRQNNRHTDVVNMVAKKANISIPDRDVGMVEGEKQRLKSDGSEGEAMNADTLEGKQL